MSLEEPSGRSIEPVNGPVSAAREPDGDSKRLRVRLDYPQDLPVSQRREEIVRALTEQQIVIVAGQTGSGKTTQLPKMCLEALGLIDPRSGLAAQRQERVGRGGREVRGVVGHTQPRRIAARSVAARLAEEMATGLGNRPGDRVGFKVRFTDQTGRDALVKVMTDGVLLAETRSDPLLRSYSAIIVDEAHERSLNIDFLIGYLKQLLISGRRPDLKVVITSATIDTERFAEHFGRRVRGDWIPAPVIEVSGRMYPVEVRYLPPDGAGEDVAEEVPELPRWATPRPRVGPDPARDVEVEDVDLPRAVLRGVDELVRGGMLGAAVKRTEVGPETKSEAEARRDVLVFLPGEREIRESAEALRKHYPEHGRGALEIIPLYARLSAEEQQRVFRVQPGGRRRVILATNVAETSLTVPGIGAVIDTGLVRLSRYSPRQKVQRLPIEWVSRASAEQRRGRAGRLGPGVCLRLYHERAFENRPEFTEPEILRTNLASVILQMMALFGERRRGQSAAELLRFRGIETFPFLDPPDQRMIRDGYETLLELGAIEPRERREVALAVGGNASGGAASSPSERWEAGLDAADVAAGESGGVEGDGAQRGYRLTRIGRDLAKFPIDPRLGRMILSAKDERCLEDVLVIVSAMSIQDPRQRPGKDRPEVQRMADEAHGKFKDGSSDFLGWLRLWRAYREQARTVGSSKLRKWCKDHFLNFLRMREWEDIHGQLRRVLKELGYSERDGRDKQGGVDTPVVRGASAASAISVESRSRTDEADEGEVVEDEARHFEVSEDDEGESDADSPPARRTAEKDSGAKGGAEAANGAPARSDAIHRSILSGLVTSVGRKSDSPPMFEYDGPRGLRFAIFPGSGLFKVNPKWVMAGEIVRTTRMYARSVAAVRPDWVERAAAHLVKRTHSDPRWDPTHTGGGGGGTVVASERVTLYGLELARGRVVEFGPIDPGQSRSIFIHHALVMGEYLTDAEWFEHNRRLVKRVAELENRVRRRGLLVDAVRRYAFYDQRVPSDVWSARTFESWRRRAERQNPRVLFMSVGDLLEAGAELPEGKDYPDSLTASALFGEGLKLGLEYQFDPADERDGITVTIPASEAERFDPRPLEWLVPGLIREKVAELIRTLPRNLRTAFVPAPEYADRALGALMPRFGKGDLLDELAERLSSMTGTRVPVDAWRPEELPRHLRVNFRVVADNDPARVLAEGRDWGAIRRMLSHKVRDALASLPDGPFNRDGMTGWDFVAGSVEGVGADVEFPHEITLDAPLSALARRAGVGKRNRADADGEAAGGASAPVPTIAAYPALADPSKSGLVRGVTPAPPARTVAVRLFDDPKRAARAMHGGLRRLMTLQVGGQIKSLIGLYPGIDRLAVAYAPIGSGQELKSHLADLVGMRAFDEIAMAGAGMPGARGTVWDGGEIRTRVAFDRAVELGWNRLGAAAEEVVTLAREVLEAYGAVSPVVGRPGTAWQGPRTWASAIADIREQLSMLVYPGALIGVPWRWLRQYPRYLRAVSVRLERLANDGPERDQRLMAEVLPFWSAFREAERARQSDPALVAIGEEPELEEFGWMVEEFRVSLFAQSLQTSVPVSPKRLLAQWEKARNARERLMQVS
ncbi:MAG: DUF3418 domain-containing protein [Phycisphaeraceae bacterium]|nr:DUF3418 domain-containing protein [Phycisphaeraceae bacterium]